MAEAGGPACAGTQNKKVWEERWLGREGSNLRMVESKSTALPLGYAPISGKRLDAGRRFSVARDGPNRTVSPCNLERSDSSSFFYGLRRVRFRFSPPFGQKTTLSRPSFAKNDLKSLLNKGTHLFKIPRAMGGLKTVDRGAKPCPEPQHCLTAPLMKASR